MDQRLVPKAAPPSDVCAPWDSRRAFIKWAFPCFLVGCGGFIGSGGLHYASYNFVHEMMAWEAANERFATAADQNLSRQITLNFTSMQDPVVSALGPRESIPMGVLDKVAIVFPALFCVLSLVTRRVEVWTKVMVCTALLAMVKGIIGAITTVPDSSGWEVCKNEHLQADGFAWMSQDHTFLEVFTVDTWWIFKYHHPLRYCSDMMYSGHTFFVTLYALGLYEVALIWTHMLCQDDDNDDYVKALDPGSKRLRRMINRWASRDSKNLLGKKNMFRMATLFLVSAVAILQQSWEIYCVLKSHFHYTSDVFVALLFTFLFYTNGVVTIFAKQWSLRDVHFLTSGHAVPTFYLKGGQQPPELKVWDDNGLTRAKPQCNFLGCSFSTCQTENPPYVDESDPDIVKEHASSNMWMSRGDIFLPICCVPFCCLAGREHVYSDSGVKGIWDVVNFDDDENNNMDPEVLEHMHMHEGISEKDVEYMWKWIRGGNGSKDSEDDKTTRGAMSNWAARAKGCRS